MPWMEAIPYFGRDELACRCGCGELRLDTSLAVHAPYLRARWGSALVATSVCRCAAHNREAEGHPRSLHLIDNPQHPTGGAAAMDLRWRGWTDSRRIKLARLAWSLGWSVGLHPVFVHVDRRIDVGLEQGAYTYSAWRAGWGAEILGGDA